MRGYLRRVPNRGDYCELEVDAGGVTPILPGSSTTGLTNVLPATAAALTAVAHSPYAHLS